MAVGDGSNTSLTLIGRLRNSPTDQAAWRQFVDRYGRRIYGWCRHWGLQESDAQDVTQTVLLELAKQMSSYVHQRTGSFRAWLKTIAYRAWCDYLEARRRIVGKIDADAVLDQLSSSAAGDDLVRRMDEECERDLLEEAKARVQLRVQPQTWEAFRLTAVEGLSGAEAAERLQMKITAVFVNRSRVHKLLEEAVRKLEAPD